MLYFPYVLCSVVKDKNSYGMPNIVKYYKSYDEAYNGAKEVIQQECYRLSEDGEYEADYENLRIIQKSDQDWSVWCMSEFPEKVIEYIIMNCEQLSEYIVKNKNNCVQT